MSGNLLTFQTNERAKKHARDIIDCALKDENLIHLKDKMDKEFSFKNFEKFLKYYNKITHEEFFKLHICNYYFTFTIHFLKDDLTVLFYQTLTNYYNDHFENSVNHLSKEEIKNLYKNINANIYNINDVNKKLILKEVISRNTKSAKKTKCNNKCCCKKCNNNDKKCKNDNNKEYNDKKCDNDNCEECNNDNGGECTVNDEVWDQRLDNFAARYTPDAVSIDYTFAIDNLYITAQEIPINFQDGNNALIISMAGAGGNAEEQKNFNIDSPGGGSGGYIYMLLNSSFTFSEELYILTKIIINFQNSTNVDIYYISSNNDVIIINAISGNGTNALNGVKGIGGQCNVINSDNIVDLKIYNGADGGANGFPGSSSGMTSSGSSVLSSAGSAPYVTSMTLNGSSFPIYSQGGTEFIGETKLETINSSGYSSGGGGCYVDNAHHAQSANVIKGRNGFVETMQIKII